MNTHSQHHSNHLANHPSNGLCELLGIKYPIIQAGMVWVSGGKLAAACANEGILGLIGAGSMSPELLRSQIQKAKSLTSGSLGVNLPLLYSKIEEQINVCLDEGIRIFFTSAGSPKKYTPLLKKEGARVVHVCSSSLLAKKCEDAGVDAVVAEGFEAGGHNGRDETTTMSLIPGVVKSVSIPVIAAGGIASGPQIAAALALGASGVQIGSRFVVTKESSAHKHFKQAIINSSEGDTKLMMKSHVPVRLLDNTFAREIEAMERSCKPTEDIVTHLGKGRAKAGMLEGDLKAGELEIGQVSALISKELSCKELIAELISETNQTISGLKTL